MKSHEESEKEQRGFRFLVSYRFRIKGIAELTLFVRSLRGHIGCGNG